MDKKTITDDKVISNHFNTFFNSAVEKLAKKYQTQLKLYLYLTVLKQFKKLLLKPLTDLINLYFSTRVFPKIFKQGKVISIIKKGYQKDCNSYIPSQCIQSLHIINHRTF